MADPNDKNMELTTPTPGAPFYGMCVTGTEGQGNVHVDRIDCFDPENVQHVDASQRWPEHIIDFFRWCAEEAGDDVRAMMDECNIEYEAPKHGMDCHCPAGTPGCPANKETS